MDGARYPEMTFWFDAPNMIIVDAPDHRRLRQVLAAIHPGVVAKWEQRVRAVVDELLAPLAEGGGDFDLITDFSLIPTVIVAEMLGVPEEQHEDFLRWSHAVTGNVGCGHERPEIRRVMDAGGRRAERVPDRGDGAAPPRADDDLLTAMMYQPD